MHKYREEELYFDLGVEQKFVCLDTRLGGLGIFMILLSALHGCDGVEHFSSIAMAVSIPGYGVFVGLWGFFDRTNLMSIWYFDL